MFQVLVFLWNPSSLINDQDFQIHLFVDLNQAQKEHLRALNQALKFYLSHLNQAQKYHVCSFKACHI